MTLYSKQLTWWGRLALSGLSVLIVLGNDYLNAISNLFTRPQREGGQVKTTTADRAGVSSGWWRYLRGRRGEDALVVTIKKGRNEMDYCCRWLPQPLWGVSSFPPSSENTNHAALCLPVSHFYSMFPVAFWKPWLLVTAFFLRPSES